MKILTVDHNDVDLFLLNSLLSYNTDLYMIGMHVYSAKNDLEALEMCQKDLYDLIFIDLTSIMDGCDVIKEIRKLNSNVVICVMSNTEESEDIQNALNDGADDFLKKPLFRDILAPKLCHLASLIKSKKMRG